MVIAGRLPPAEMFPAGRPELLTRYLDLESGLRVRAVECGDRSAPRIVLIPGWGCSALVFRENLLPLANAGFHTVAVELKGHGLSDKPQGRAEYTLASMREHVTQILDALGGEKVTLAGLSMGAALAAHVAASHPDRVCGVVMGSPVGFDGVPGLWVIRLATLSPVAPLLPRIASRTIVAAILRLVYGKLRRVTDGDIDQYWAPTQFPEFTAAMRLLLHEFTWRVPFAPLSVPALLITGARDPLIRRSSANSYRSAPELHHIEIRDSGHVVFDEAPSIVNQAMIEFARKARGT